jgi:histidinol-phosphatase (PHP family)
VRLFDDFYAEAQRLRNAYADKIQILIGFESEWIRPSTLRIIHGILEKYTFDFFMGSIHHTHKIPIDYDRAMYEQARDVAGGTDERLFEDYFDSQFEMLQALRPPVVGHFDLIRLLSDHRDAEFKDMTRVWEKMQRNLKYIASYDGRLELNSSGLRKGLAEPYPCLSICQVCHTAHSAEVRIINCASQMFLRLGGAFVMSDDSHGIEHIGTNYARLLTFIQRAGIEEIHYVDTSGVRSNNRFPTAGFASITTSKLAALPFWNNIQL